jgi:uncharacterized protein YbaA (DUF1428 family)
MKTKGKYIDAFLLAVPKKKLEAYRRISHKAGKIWEDYGALEYRECAADDINIKGMGTSFSKRVKLKPTETVIFSWIVYKSRAHRDAVNKKVMKDPRMDKMMAPGEMPFELNRMSYGGFRIIVNL